MGPTGQGGERERIERELERHATDEARQRRGSTPPEDVMRRALELETHDPGAEPAEPGVEWHAGEDAGEVPEPGRD